MCPRNATMMVCTKDHRNRQEATTNYVPGVVGGSIQGRLQRGAVTCPGLGRMRAIYHIERYGGLSKTSKMGTGKPRIIHLNNLRDHEKNHNEKIKKTF